jgi:chromosome segregation ATPase
MTQESEFERLEQFVGRLLTKFDHLRKENARLENLLQQKELEIGTLNNELASADTARGDITNRVKGLIEQIEEWESALSANDDVHEETATDTGSTTEEKKAEGNREGSLQKNLFNIEPRMTQAGG